jgi:Tfp pilus assembly protein FimT
MRGFTLLEIVIIMAIFSVLTVAGVTSITKFQKQARLDSTTNELVNNLRLANTKSVTGELLETEVPSNFEETGLPQYGVLIDDATHYSLIRQYQLVGQSITTETLNTIDITDEFSLSPVGTSIIFIRPSGITSSTTITLQQINSPDTTDIVVQSNGSISVNQP